MAEEHQHLDRALKLVWNHHPRALLALAAGDAREVQPLNTELHLRRHADLVGWVGSGRGRYLLHIELESSPKAGLPSRVLAYNVLLREAHKVKETRPLVRSVVLVLRRNRSPVPDRVLVRDGEDLVLDFRFHVVRIFELDAVDLAHDPDLAMFTPLGKGCTAAELHRAAAALRDAGHTDRSDPVAALFALSSSAQRGILRGILDMREVRLSIGYTEILKEGRLEGRQEGRLEGLQQAVARLAARRFPRSTGPLEELLPRCEEGDLTWLLDELLEARSGAAVTQALRRRLDARGRH